ncbi:GNAT family N-acetyltransferase [uncultured Alistipes sp.]|uniref:GNAT family N-acetyltransferase n=1 Tax=uncultured Alistipes sp. TaxID=538949 RepID=UPI0025E56EB7|nr:GNAT family N-acetyltransferase [uncultured Alistipes sp.]
MIQKLQFIPFKSRSDKGWAEAWEFYENSFPHCERWNPENYDRAFDDPHFEADGIWRGEELIGIIFHWDVGGYRYLEHLAISPALRGQNMGSVALSAFCDKVRKVILEIDPPVDDISIRRQRFYERLGFVTNPYEYIHPSFRKPFQAHQLILMSYPGAISHEEASAFADFVREEVLSKYSEHEAPTLPRLPEVQKTNSKNSL